MSGRLKKRFYEIMELSSAGDRAAKVFQIFILSLIFVNVLAVIFETVEPFFSRYRSCFRYFEVFSVCVFTVEYALRLWCSSENPKYSGAAGKVRFVFTPFAIVDLLAILPFFLPMVIPVDLRFLRAIRLVRFFRILKIGRYYEDFRTIGRMFRSKKEELMISVLVFSILLVICSSLMYFVENKAQPNTFSSIPAAMWWGIATLTTIGYGDIYPVTTAGKVLGSFIAILGVGMGALPAGILASGMIEEIQKKRRVAKKCPHCGKDIEVEENRTVI
jgi:voltage-gated potassium channel